MHEEKQIDHYGDAQQHNRDDGNQVYLVAYGLQILK